MLNRFAGDLWGAVASYCLYPYAERRMGRAISPKLKILKREAMLPFSERKRHATEMLVGILEHAGADVPYYRELFKKCHFDPQSMRKDTRYLSELPFLSKDVLREQGERLISLKHVDKIIRAQKTGGTTGPSATIWYDQQGVDWTAAQNRLMLAWGGKRSYNREAHLSTRFTSPLPAEAIRNEMQKCFVLNRQNIYTDGFSGTAQETLLADLRRAHATVVQGHPSSMYALAHYLQNRGELQTKLFDIFVSTGEMIRDDQRTLIEEIFGCRVSNRYGACEFGVMAQELKDGPKGELLVSDSLVWPEILRLEDVGDVGELVFTGLRNPAMPLIRYRMGDLGQLEERPDGWWIAKIVGRMHDTVSICGTNYPTHFIQDIFDRCGDIVDFQILVKGELAVEFRIVASPENWESISRAVSENFPSVPIRRIESNELVSRGRRGKFSYLVREDV